MSQELVSAVVLSGGRARRLGGKDKGLYLYKNKPLIQYVIDALSPHVSDIVISANRNLEQYKEYSPVVVNDGNDQFEGALKGLSMAVPWCQSDQVLVTTCDLPLLPDDLTNLFDQNATVEIQVISVLGRMQLCFLMKKSVLPSLVAYVNDGNYRVMQWIQSTDHQIISYQGAEKHFQNFNCPSDFLD